MPPIRVKKCALGNHALKQPSGKVKDPRLVRFVRMAHKDFRPEEPLCMKCLRALEKVYNEKSERAKLLQAGRHTHSISSLTSSSSAAENSHGASMQLRRRQQRQIATTQRRSGSASPTTTTTTTSASIRTERSATAGTAKTAAASLIAQPSQSSQSTLDEGPSTSAAAARARTKGGRNLRQPPVTADDDASGVAVPNMPSGTDDDNDDDYVPSPNALNGTRLPHIQPVPKRQQFVHVNADVMDIYFAGLTGG